jgi:5,10-methenyltetrahydrofolate synthetase
MTLQAFRTLLADYSFCVTYSPLLNEAPLPSVIPDEVETFTLPTDATNDPFDTARELIQKAAGRKTVVLLPGTRFDAAGTRHGRGSGWYDRFLSAVPAEWLRIGVCTEAQFSIEPLTRESWDEPVDYIVVGDELCRSVVSRLA